MGRQPAATMPETVSVETAHCTLTLLEEGRLLVQRFKPTMRFEQPCIQEAILARERIMGEGPPCALLVVIPEGVPVNAESTNTDHFLGERLHQRILALAVVPESAEMRSAAKLYFTWHQQVFPALVASSEAEGLAWLRERLGARA